MGIKRRFARGNRPELFRLRNGAWEHKHEQHWYYHPALRTHHLRKEEVALSLFEGCIVKTTYVCERLLVNSGNSRVGVVREVRQVEWGHLAEVILDTGEKRLFDVRNLELCGNGWYGPALAERISEHKNKKRCNLPRTQRVETETHTCANHADKICPHEHCSCDKPTVKKSEIGKAQESLTRIEIEDAGGYQLVSGEKTIYMSRNKAPHIGVVDVYTGAGAYCGKAELRECYMPNKMVFSCLSKNAANYIPYELFSIYFWGFKPVEVLYEGDHVRIKESSVTGIITGIDGDKATVETAHGYQTVALGELALATHQDKPTV